MTAIKVQEAAERIRPYLAPTPLLRLGGSGLALKAESLQPSGAFKVRGALNKLLSLPHTIRGRGVVAHSGGNHGIAVAFAARLLGTCAILVVPRDAPRAKTEAIRAYGGKVIFAGVHLCERASIADDLARKRGLALIPPFDDRDVIAGAGTAALEVLRQQPDLQTLFVPVAGGGLAAGAAAALAGSHVRLVAVEPELNGHVGKSLAARANMSVTEEDAARTVADALKVCRLGQHNWENITGRITDVVRVADDEIEAAMMKLAAEARLIVEPAGAVALAGALKWGQALGRAAAIVSGGNVDLPVFTEVLARRLGVPDAAGRKGG